MVDEPLVYRVPDAARLLGVGRNEVRDLLHRGELIGWRDGASGYWRIPRQSIEQYVARRIAEAEADRAIVRAAAIRGPKSRHPTTGNRQASLPRHGQVHRVPRASDGAIKH